MPAQHINLSFASDGETLAATDILPESGTVAHSILSLHGAGSATRQRIFYLADALAQNRYRTFCLDFSGHGESSGQMKESSLARRHIQARDAHRRAGFKGPLTVMGSSMGGYIAVSLLPFVEAGHLILMCPGLYATDAYDVPFTDAFTEILRRPDSYEKAHMLEVAKSYRGHVQLIIGEEDTVIPPRVMELYQNAFTNAASLLHTRLPGVPHQIHAWATAAPERVTLMHDLIHHFISGAEPQMAKVRA